MTRVAFDLSRSVCKKEAALDQLSEEDEDFNEGVLQAWPWPSLLIPSWTKKILGRLQGRGYGVGGSEEDESWES